MGVLAEWNDKITGNDQLGCGVVAMRKKITLQHHRPLIGRSAGQPRTKNRQSRPDSRGRASQPVTAIAAAQHNAATATTGPVSCSEPSNSAPANSS